jgi:hypothetical protein
VHLQEKILQHLHLACLRVSTVEQEKREKEKTIENLSKEKEALKVIVVFLETKAC